MPCREKGESKEKSFLGNVACGVWRMVGYINTIRKRSQKPVIRQKIPVGSKWQSWLFMAWHPRGRERKRQRHGGKGQEARVPTHTWRHINPTRPHLLQSLPPLNSISTQGPSLYHRSFWESLQSFHTGSRGSVRSWGMKGDLRFSSSNGWWHRDWRKRELPGDKEFCQEQIRLRILVEICCRDGEKDAGYTNIGLREKPGLYIDLWAWRRIIWGGVWSGASWVLPAMTASRSLWGGWRLRFYLALMRWFPKILSSTILLPLDGITLLISSFTMQIHAYTPFYLHSLSFYMVI